MSNKKKITLVEAQDLYVKNEVIREFLEGKFSKEEFTATTPPQEAETPEEKFKRVWETKILSQCYSVRFLSDKFITSKVPTPHIEVLDKEGRWLFDYDYSSKNKHFWYSELRIKMLLEKEVSSDFVFLQGLIKSWVEDTLGLQGVIPFFWDRNWQWGVEDTLELQGVIPESV